MTNEENHTNFEALIAKYLSGEADDREVKHLEEWVQVTEENKIRFLEYRKAWRSTAKRADVDVDAEWKRQEDRLFGSSKAIDFTPSPKSNVGLGFVMRIAAAVILLVALGYAAFYMFENRMKTVVASNEHLTLTLDDGSEVTLNRDSRLTYHTGFDEEQRKVLLDGDGYFEVTRDESRPFIVETGRITVEVLGTAFYVNARESSIADEVVVSSGSVKVEAGEAVPVVVSAGQKAIYSRQAGLLAQSVNEDVNYLSWKTGKLVFDDVSLVQVVQELSKAYGEKVELGNNNLRTCMLTAIFEGQSLEDVLTIICETLGLGFEKRHGVYVITGEACN